MILWSKIGNIREARIVETLNHNKVALKFERKLERDPALKERFFEAFPSIKVFCHNLNTKIEQNSVAFNHIKRKFSENSIAFILIKSDGSFPYESDNIDVLIKPGMLGSVSKMLRNAGYTELSEIRERHKFLFRNKHAPEVLPLHIHTMVEWEGTEFIDSRDLWRTSRNSDDNEFSVPSPENCILITAAHLFFEDHEIKLGDLSKIEFPKSEIPP